MLVEEPLRRAALALNERATLITADDLRAIVGAEAAASFDEGDLDAGAIRALVDEAFAESEVEGFTLDQIRAEYGLSPQTQEPGHEQITGVRVLRREKGNMNAFLRRLRAFWAHLVTEPTYIHPSERTRRLSRRR